MQDQSPNPTVLRMNAVTRADRLACTAAVREAIVTSCRGWIGDFYQYSNTSLCLHFELPATNLVRLRDSFTSAGLNLSEVSQEALERALGKELESPTVSCMLQITFVHDEPDLRRYVPPIPG